MAHVCRPGGPFDDFGGIAGTGHAEVLSSLSEIDTRIVVDQVERSWETAKTCQKSKATRADTLSGRWKRSLSGGTPSKIVPAFFYALLLPRMNNTSATMPLVSSKRSSQCSSATLLPMASYGSLFWMKRLTPTILPGARLSPTL